MERGIVGLTCARHGTPLMAVDMPTAERFDYADFLISKIIEAYGLRRHYHVFYDIACSYSVNFEVNFCIVSLLFSLTILALQERMQSNYGINNVNVSFYVPAFHANAHVMSCIYKYHPKRFPEVGVIDGEDLERLWSTLGNFSPIVRNMSREARREQLEDALLGARARSLATLRERLKAKFQKIGKHLIFKQECLESFRPVHVSNQEFEDQIRSWLQEQHVLQDPERPSSLIGQLRAFIGSQYRLLKSRKSQRGQIYLQKVMKSIFKAKRKIQTLVSDGMEEDVAGFEDLEDKELIVQTWLDLKRYEKELTYLSQDMERLLTPKSGVLAMAESGKLYLVA